MKQVISILTFLLIAVIANAQAKFEQPVLITSAGQSADVKLVKLLAKKAGVEAETMLMAKPDDLANCKTLIIVPGFSSKGLGAAGISQEDEMARVNEVIKAANEKGIPIVLAHIGGIARRFGQSDGFCQVVAENSKSMILVKQGNEDGFFTKIAESKSIPIQEVDKISGAVKPISELF